MSHASFHPGVTNCGGRMSHTGCNCAAKSGAKSESTKPLHSLEASPDDESIMRVDGQGNKIHYSKKSGEIHNAYGPALEQPDGTKSFYIEGRLHNPDGPAVVRADGAVSFYINDKLHNPDGPARTFANGRKDFYIDGEFVRSEDHRGRELDQWGYRTSVRPSDVFDRVVSWLPIPARMRRSKRWMKT